MFILNVLSTRYIRYVMDRKFVIDITGISND